MNIERVNNQDYRAAIYIRLSKEDGDREESESVTNQRKILKAYAKENKYKIYDEYVDDGYTGTNFNRPSFKRMIKDIEDKKINIVITKNLARLGRNYIETGTYIEKYFPDHRVRYIAILDRVDNFEDSVSNDFVPIKSVFNEKHCKDTSIAVKKTKRRKMQEGFYACNTPPFGYKKDPDNPGKLIVDEESSKTVKKIFELKEKGFTISKIVEYLGENNYKTPAEYLNIRGLERVNNKNIWRPGTVKRILSNEVYLGYCVRGKTQKIFYKSKKRMYIKRDDFIITKNTHEPLISEETFNKVHNFNKLGKTQRHIENKYLLKDLIYCKNCGKKLMFVKSWNNVFVVCRCSYQNIKLCDNDCRINYELIEDKLFNYIVEMYNEFSKSTKLKDNIYKKYTKNVMDGQANELDTLKNELGKVNFRITSLYNQRLLEKIDDENYKNRYKELIEKRNLINKKISIFEKEINEENIKINNLDYKKKILKKVSNLEKKDFDNLNIKELIEKIEVFKNEIYVYFTFGDIGKIDF